jgi:basic amino acid/polyamine antiporter, APA family
MASCTFDAVSTAAQTRNPQKDMPLAILGTLAICTLLYVLVSVVITGIVTRSRSAPMPSDLAGSPPSSSLARFLD